MVTLPHIELIPIPATHLPALAQSKVPEALRDKVLADGLPPAHVARRIIQRLSANKPAAWVSMYYVLDADGCCIAGCGFKDVPQMRQVEIGYGVAAARRGLGYASAAVHSLLRMAAASGEVDVVTANIALDNTASMQVARRAGFVPGETLIDDGDLCVCWRCSVAEL